MYLYYIDMWSVPCLSTWAHGPIARTWTRIRSPPLRPYPPYALLFLARSAILSVELSISPWHRRSISDAAYTLYTLSAKRNLFYIKMRLLWNVSSGVKRWHSDLINENTHTRIRANKRLFCVYCRISWPHAVGIILINIFMYTTN